MIVVDRIFPFAAVETEKRPLWRKFPTLSNVLPIIPVAALPTPVELVPALGDGLSIPGLFIKRDDVSGALYGGAKLRAAEVVLGAAINSGRKHLLCTSVAASNWLTICAIYGKALGLRVHLMGLERELDENKRNNLEIQQAIADDVVIQKNPLNLLRRALQLSKEYRGDVFFGAPGGTSSSTSLSYVNAMFELAEQIRARRLPEPKFIFCGLGSCGTAAGLALGAVLAGLRSRIVAIRIADRFVSNRFNVGRLVWSAMKKLRRCDTAASLSENPLHRLSIEQHYFGPGYGRTYPDAERMKDLMIETVGVPLDDTYTSKVVWGMADYCHRHRIGKAPVLYWHSLNSRQMQIHELSRSVKELFVPGPGLELVHA
jgi:1-aminocyclopropane-1-carboxylate deaminase/D-cysteine desulfhydrase-like pyridoxal-dependent ACC family enzyme